MFRAFPRRFYATYRSFNRGAYPSNGATLLANPTFRKLLGGGAVAGGIFYASNLEQAPITNRTRFMWVGEGLEKFVGDQTYSQILSETRGMLLPDDHPYSRKVRKIMQNLVAASQSPDLQKLDWKIHIVNDPRQPPNAFVLPGGKVFVYSSILQICENDDGLATVLAHELSHQLARHSSEQLSKAPIYMLLSLALYALTGSDALNTLLINSALKMPASREMETEADYMGLMIMSRACYNPEESTRLWGRMTEFEKKHGGATPEFLSTHPASAHRIKNMQEWIPEAIHIREESNCQTMGQFSVFGRGW
ncbi:hypothetical protein BABINDRAFT_6835 [Babjeviella inositovora NRRL Y-12698]|uniref:Peptidase M48 domain-containing protein n=1 Tax=Babjeviella inositovora NRRL Y-12698 TaxID=984486 RepID=A0A1E3QTV2_9ASCO|nr:uncharacterized protein BABINDRAFT_6835 [Babjeviella inositovora NRRL Y-12698]ODQ80974.1 hypothetical protein BABINDRAFT_6835 [Babjeviella inositovora NRRL Y-12698]